MKFILHLVVSWLAVAAAAYILPWVEVDGFVTALIVAVVLWLVNMTLGVVLRLLTLPLNILSFGLIGFVISILLIQLVDNRIDGFSVGWWLNAALFAIVLGIIQW
jgi:putative membrane protein